MNRTKKILTLVTGLACLTLLVYLIWNRYGQQNTSASIAVILPLTGNSAFLGEFCKNGMILAADEVNTNGGIVGKQLELEFADSKNEPKEGITVFQKALLSRPNAVIVAMSSVTTAVAPLADSERIPLFATMVSSKGATDGHPSMFRLFINADIDARLMAEFAAKTKGMKKIVIVNVNDEMGASFSSVFTKTFSDLGGSIVSQETFDKSAIEFRDIAAKIRSIPSDAIYLLGYDRNLGQLAKSLREQGITQPFLSIATIAQEPVRTAAGDTLNNTYFTSVGFNAESPSGSKEKEFVLAYEKRFGKKPTYFSAFAYDSVMLLASAMRSVGTSSESIIQGLQKISSYEGATGKISLQDTRDAKFPMVVKKIEEGQIKAAE